MSIKDAIDAYNRRLMASLPKRLQLPRGAAAKTGAALLAYLAGRKYSRAIEFGSSFGILPAYVAAGLAKPVVLYVLESNSERAAIAEKTMSRLLPAPIFWELIPGMPRQTAAAVFRNLNPVDYVHVEADGHYELTLSFFEMALSVMRAGGTISGCFKGSAMRALLKAIRDHDRIAGETKLGDRIAFEIK